LIIFKSSASGTKSKIVVFGEWGPFTYNAPAKLLQLPDAGPTKPAQPNTDSAQSNSLPAMVKTKPFTQQQQQQQQSQQSQTQLQGQNKNGKNTNVKDQNNSQPVVQHYPAKTKKTAVTKQPKSFSHLTQRLTPDDCREALTRWVTKQRCKNKKVPNECHITGIVSYQTIDVRLQYL
jgi:hypothetical protein